MEIEIENWRPGIQYDSDKSLATFDVRVGESLYIDLRLMKNKNGHFFLSYPSKRRKDIFGESVYQRFYDWGKERNEQFEKAVLTEIKTRLREPI